MTSFLRSMSCLAAFLGAGSAQAQDPLPHVFERDTPARANEVNENFNAVNDAAASARAVGAAAQEAAEEARSTAEGAQGLAGAAQAAADALAAQLQPVLDGMLSGLQRFSFENGGSLTFFDDGSLTAIEAKTPSGEVSALRFQNREFVVNMDHPSHLTDEFVLRAQNGTGTATDGTNLFLSSEDSVRIVLNSDTNNGDEKDQPSVVWSQDGGQVVAQAGFFDESNQFYIESPTGSTIALSPEGGSVQVLDDLFVFGEVFKGGGSFLIDHPLDPANKYMRHSFVESPEMMNVYNGNITTDGTGHAVVELPDWFEALNRDFRYQLTPIGQFAQAIVLEKVSGNQFSILTDLPFVEVSWQVTGVRQDPYAEANRIESEYEKQPENRGMYLYPEVFGLPKEMRIAQPRPKKMGEAF